MGRPTRPPPVGHVVSGDWPHARLDDNVGANVGQAFAAQLQAAIEGMSLREVERRTGVDHTTVVKIVSGVSWPDLITIAKLEAGLDRDLWPGRCGDIRPGRRRNP